MIGGFGSFAILGCSPIDFPYLLSSPDTASILVGYFLELASTAEDFYWLNLFYPSPVGFGRFEPYF